MDALTVVRSLEAVLPRGGSNSGSSLTFSFFSIARALARLNPFKLFLNFVVKSLKSPSPKYKALAQPEPVKIRPDPPLPGWQSCDYIPTCRKKAGSPRVDFINLHFFRKFLG
jgi:hypothetical protein